MRPRNGQFNPKRRLRDSEDTAPLVRVELAKRVRYGGNAEHKLRPGDYGLGPIRPPRPGKTLCDADGPFDRATAEALLTAGILKGMVSVQQRGDLPQNIWSVSDAGVAYEAQLENPVLATYHGYPLAHDDDFRRIVLEEWARR